MRLIARIAAAELVLAMLALVVMGSVTVCDVVLKYLFNRPITGAYDLVESLMPVVVFYALPATLLRRQNIVIDLADHLLGPARIKPLVRIGDVIMTILLSAIAVAAIAPALQAFDYGDRKLELGLPLIITWTAAIVGMFSAALIAFVLALRPPSLAHGEAD